MQLAFCLFKYFPFGGLQRDFLRIALACQRRGHAVRVYALEWQGDVPEGFELVRVPVKALTNPRRYAKFAAWVQKDLAARPADRVIGFNKMQGLDVYYAADPCFEDKARTLRGPLYRLSARYRHFAAFERAVFAPESRTQILTISDLQRALYARHYGTPEARFHPLPPGIAPDRRAPPNAANIRADFRREFGLGQDDRLIVQIGSGFKTKGLGRSLKALAALPPELKARTRLIAIGQDDPAPFLRQARTLGLSDRVEILRGREDIPRFLLGADLLIHPAYNENTGTVLLEAVVAGLPVLTTAACGYAHYIGEADAGRVVPLPFEQAVLDGWLAEMLLDDDARRRWSENGLFFADSADLYSLPERAADVILRGKTCSVPHSFEAAEALEGTVLRALEGRRTLRTEIDGQGYYAKIHRGVGWGEILKNLFSGRLPVLGARNEWRSIRRLETLGVDTMKAVAFGEEGWNPAARRSFLITEELAPTVSLEDFCRDWRERPPHPTLKRALVRRVAEMARRMHAGGVNHRDLYLCHFLLHLDPPPSPERFKLSLIDLHRAQLREGPAPRRWVDKDLAALYFSSMDIGLTRRDRLRFLKTYFNRPLRETLRREAARLDGLEHEATLLLARYWRKFAPRAGPFGTLDAIFSLKGELVARDSLSHVVRVTVDGRRYYVKRYQGVGKKPLRRIFAEPRVQAEWENLRHFEAWGIPTAKAVAFGLERSHGRFGRFVRGALVTEEIPGTTDLRRIAKRNDPRLADRRWVASISRQLARTARRMHAHGFAHGDLKWRNLLVDDRPDPTLYLIDCPSGRFWWGPFLGYRIVKDLACLDKVAKYRLCRTQRLRFYLDYAQKRRLDASDKARINRIVHFFEGRE